MSMGWVLSRCLAPPAVLSIHHKMLAEPALSDSWMTLLRAEQWMVRVCEPRRWPGFGECGLGVQEPLAPRGLPSCAPGPQSLF